jgi:hypothetical protein
MSHRFPFSVLVALVFASCATTRSLGDRQVNQLDTVINAYVKAHPDRMFPITRPKLVAFAAEHRMPLDLSAVRIVTWSTGPTYVLVRCRVSVPEVHESILHYGKEPM